MPLIDGNQERDDWPTVLVSNSLGAIPVERRNMVSNGSVKKRSIVLVFQKLYDF